MLLPILLLLFHFSTTTIHALTITRRSCAIGNSLDVYALQSQDELVILRSANFPNSFSTTMDTSILYSCFVNFSTPNPDDRLLLRIPIGYSTNPINVNGTAGESAPIYLDTFVSAVYDHRMTSTGNWLSLAVDAFVSAEHNSFIAYISVLPKEFDEKTTCPQSGQSFDLSFLQPDEVFPVADSGWPVGFVAPVDLPPVACQWTFNISAETKVMLSSAFFLYPGAVQVLDDQGTVLLSTDIGPMFEHKGVHLPASASPFSIRFNRSAISATGLVDFFAIYVLPERSQPKTSNCSGPIDPLQPASSMQDAAFIYSDERKAKQGALVFQEPYSPGLNCSYNLSLDPSINSSLHEIHVAFFYAQIENTADELIVAQNSSYWPATSGQVIYLYGGDKKGRLSFLTDQTINAGGFAAIVYTTLCQCPGDSELRLFTNGSRSTITSAHYTLETYKDYCQNLTCNYFVDVPRGYQVRGNVRGQFSYDSRLITRFLASDYNSSTDSCNFLHVGNGAATIFDFPNVPLSNPSSDDSARVQIQFSSGPQSNMYYDSALYGWPAGLPFERYWAIDLWLEVSQFSSLPPPIQNCSALSADPTSSTTRQPTITTTTAAKKSLPSRAQFSVASLLLLLFLREN